MTKAIAWSKSSVHNFLPKSKNKSYVMCAWIVSNHSRPDHAPVVIVIQSERLKHSISPRNQSAKHPDSGCFSISGVLSGSALSKRWRSGPEAFRGGPFLRLDRNRKPPWKASGRGRVCAPDQNPHATQAKSAYSPRGEGYSQYKYTVYRYVRYEVFTYSGLKSFNYRF